MSTRHKTLAAVLAVAAAIGAAAYGQPADTISPLERLRNFVDERARTRPKLDPPPLGRPPLGAARPDIDWAAVDRLLSETRARDARFRALTNARGGIAPPPSGLRAVPAENLPRTRLPELRRVLLPVLAPSTPSVLASLKVYGQPDAYTATATADDGVAIRVSGSRKKLLLDRPPALRERLRKLRSAKPPLPGMGSLYIITRSEYSVDLSFSRFGAGYVLSLLCDDQDTDARCTEDDYITELASSMALLNESEERGQ